MKGLGRNGQVVTSAPVTDVGERTASSPPRPGTEGRAPGLLLLIGLGSAALLAAFVLFSALHLNVPSGWSSRLGEEPDVTHVFPWLWLWKPFALSSSSTTPVDFMSRAKLLVCGIWLAYGVTVALVFRLPRVEGRRALAVIATGAVLCHVVLVLTPPFLSGDLFQNSLFGRMVSAYGLNPYVDSAARLQGDPLWRYASWNFLTAHYGPSFTYLSAVVTWLSGGSVLWTAMGFKVMSALASLATCWLIRDVSARWKQDDGVRAFALYALNPLVLLETSGMGHNEAVVVLLALAGVSLSLRGHPWLAIMAFVVSADMKQVTAIVGLLFTLRFVFEGEGWRERSRRAAGTVLVCAAVEIVLWARFWAGAAVFSTARAILSRGPELKLAAPAQGTSVVRLALFGALVVACGASAARGGAASRLLNSSALVGVVFLIWIFPFHWAWYAIPPLALATAARRSRANALLLSVILGYGLLFTQLYVRLHPLPPLH